MRFWAWALPGIMLGTSSLAALATGSIAVLPAPAEAALFNTCKRESITIENNVSLSGQALCLRVHDEHAYSSHAEPSA